MEVDAITPIDWHTAFKDDGSDCITHIMSVFGGQGQCYGSSRHDTIGGSFVYDNSIKYTIKAKKVEGEQEGPEQEGIIFS